MIKIIHLFYSFYKKIISPLLGNNCRFHPTCSEYMMGAIEEFGFVRGSWLAMKRLARCNSLCSGGLDPVPHKCVNNLE